MTLDPNVTDRLVAVGKSAAGLVPWAGSVVGEIVGAVIPQQRIDRVVDFLRRVDRKTARLEDEIREQRVRRDLDLVEAAVVHASRAPSEERRERIAALVANSLNSADVDLQREKHLLDLLAELNDTELLLLQWYGLGHGPEAHEFFDRHQDVLTVPPATLGSGPEVVDREKVHDSYRHQLVRLGLIRPRFQSPRRGELPEFDEKTGMMKAGSNEITWLGRMVLAAADLPDDLRAREIARETASP